MKERFYKLSQGLAARRDLRATDKIIYAVILDHIGSNGAAWPGKRSLARKTGLAGDTICNSIRRLEAKGMLNVERRGNGKSNHYKSGPEILPAAEPDRSETQTGGGPKPGPEAVRSSDPNQTDLFNQTTTTNFVFVLKTCEHWQLPQAKLDQYRRTYPGKDIGAELRKAGQWLIDNPKRRKTKRGMPKFLNGWLSRCGPAAIESKNQPGRFDSGREAAFFDKFIQDNAPTAQQAEAILQEAGLA